MNLKDALNVVHVKEIALQWQFSCKNVKDADVYGTLEHDLKIHKVIAVVASNNVIVYCNSSNPLVGIIGRGGIR